jgi:hypothetical protein
VLLGLVVVCALATLLGSVLARLVSRPLGELARAFERMRVELGEYLTALRSSRDELARSMNRLGETLSSTHDLPKLLAVVLEAAVQARRARAGSLLMLTVDRTALVREATYGLTHRDPAERIPVGHRRAQPVRPRGRRAVHPGRRRGPDRLRGPGGGGHRERQAARQAERLSVTDPLTGAWNYRYFSRRFEQEIERSRRFARYGGEEFVLILPETNLEGGLAVAEKLRLATHRAAAAAVGRAARPDGGKGGQGRVESASDQRNSGESPS